VVFGLCGYFWRRVPSGLHHLIAPLGCLVAVGGYAWVALVLHSGWWRTPWCGCRWRRPRTRGSRWPAR